jgi:hypothetical protein
MAELACRLEAVPSSGGYIGLAFTLVNESGGSVTLTYYEPVTPSRLRAWVDGSEVPVAIPPTSLQMHAVEATLEPGEQLALSSAVYLQFDPAGGYGAGEDMFRWALVSEPGPLEIEAAIQLEATDLPSCRAQVTPVA